MARWQKVYLERRTAEPATSTYGTVQTDLPEQDFITSLNITPYNTSYATTVNSGLIPSFLSVKNIEVVDGANIIQSLSGAEAQAEQFYRGGTNPCPMRFEGCGMENFDEFYMRFGRYDGDPELMLDCNQLTNPQVKLTYDYVTTVYDGLTYTCPTTPNFLWTVLADVLRGPPEGAPRGFIRSRRIYDYHQAVSATEYIDIPRTEPIYGIMMRGGYIGKNLKDDFSQVKLNINNDEWVPFNIIDDELYCCATEWWPDEPAVSYRVTATDEHQWDSGLGYVVGQQGDIKWGTPILAHFTTDFGGYPKMQFFTTSTGAESDTTWPVYYQCIGKFPHHTFYLPMSEVVDGSAYALDATQTSKIQLALTSSASASASATIEIILDTIANYTRW